MKPFNLGVYKLKYIENKFRNLFCRAYFRCNDETCNWFLTRRNPMLDRFFFLCDFKIRMFSIICAFICYLITTFISAAVNSMSSNAYLIRYHFNIGGCFINRNKNKLFWGHLKTAYDVNFFRIGLDLDSLILILNFDIF